MYAPSECPYVFLSYHCAITYGNTSYIRLQCARLIIRPYASFSVYLHFQQIYNTQFVCLNINTQVRLLSYIDIAYITNNDERLNIYPVHLTISFCLEIPIP